MRGGLIALQLALVCAALAVVTAAPPAQGRMLLVPVTASAARQLVPLVAAHRGSIVAVGPVAGSLVVEGSRAELLAPMTRAAILTIATRDRGCGKGA